MQPRPCIIGAARHSMRPAPGILVVIYYYILLDIIIGAATAAEPGSARAWEPEVH